MPTGRRDAFLDQLRATFLVEAREHLHVLSSTMLELEREASGADAAAGIERAFRSVHSLKGAAHAVELGSVELLCQSLEDVLAALRDGRLAASAAILDLIQPAIDAVSVLVEAVAGPLPAIAGLPDVPALRQALRVCLADVRQADLRSAAAEAVAQLSAGTEPARAEAEATASAAVARDSVAVREPAAADESAPPADGWVRVPLGSLEAHLHDAEALQSARMAARQRVRELDEFAGRLADWQHRLGRQAGADGLAAAGLLVQQASLAARHARSDFEALSRVVDAIQSRARHLLYLPFGVLSRPLPRVVRDLARKQGKAADLWVDGDEVEIDRRIVDRLRDPLLHLLRNAVDHGVEPPEARAARGKPARAALRLTAAIGEDHRLRVIVADDGTGIDTAAVRRRLVAAGRVAEREAGRLADAEVLSHVFDSGLSTRDAVTALSGRGLGLAIVRDAVSRLDGEITVESVPGQGTTFRLTLPLSLSADRGIVVRVANRLLLVPSRSALTVGLASGVAVRSVEGFTTVQVGERVLPFADLGRALGLAGGSDGGNGAGGHAAAAYIVVGGESAMAALAVDDVLGEQEVVVKPMPAPLVGLPFIDGIAVMGAGVVVPIIGVSALLRAAHRLSAVSPRPSAPGSPPLRRRTILVAEDSITSRLLLKAILESAGHEVRTAVDGCDAYQQLLTGQFAMLVSDVDMPHLDGCALTAQIRAHPQLGGLPVVLVTARESPQDRVRGIEAGANAYLGKRSFDQGELLRIVGALL